MNRIDHPTAVGGLFVDPNPPAIGTRLPAAFLNGVQEELIAAIVSAGLAPSAGDLTQLTQAIRILSTGAGGLKNAVINGDLQIWQRGQTFNGIALVPTYTADRWVVTADGSGGAGTANVTRQGFESGQTAVPGARNFLRYAQATQSTAGGGRIRTKLEGVESFAGRTVSVTMYLRAASATTVTIQASHALSLSSTIVGDADSVSVTTSWQKFSVSLAMPTLAGQTIDHATAHFLLELQLPAGTPQLDVARVQVERSAIPSDFEIRPESLELAMCQRYYLKSYEQDTSPGSVNVLRGCATSIDAFDELEDLNNRFPVPMRAIPTITWYSPVTGTANRVHQRVGAVEHSVTGTFFPSRVATGWPVIGQVLDQLRVMIAHYTADADL